MLYSYLDKRRIGKYWKKVCFSIFSRIVLNSYIIVKEIMPAGSKPVSRLDYTIKIVEALSEEWLKKNTTAGISGTRNKQTDSKYLRKLSAKKEKNFCVCS